MKALKCEMCDSTDLVKDGDYFVCQNCGTKYTVETAKKMMFEGTVDVSGSTVKIDHSEEVENLLKYARKLRAAGDYGAAGEYYEKISDLESDNWEVTFFFIIWKIKKCVGK
ncbi:MAG: hypothetical protein SPE25_03260 [Lachnospiraceae bacterium]|nr:hypothetical protein [Lachnospiraceae bacterium]